MVHTIMPENYVNYTDAYYERQWIIRIKFNKVFTPPPISDIMGTNTRLKYIRLKEAGDILRKAGKVS